MNCTNSKWLVGGASVRGANHKRSGRPNEDALRSVPSDAGVSHVIAAVSDGHGSPPHFRSGKGAKFAVDAAAKILAWHIDSAEGDEMDDILATEIVGHWRQLINDDVRNSPFSAEELALCRGIPSIAYGSTLIAFGSNDTIANMLQIGDGDMLIGYEDGRIVRPLRADEGLKGEETYSLCQDDAQQHFRLATLWHSPDDPWPDFAMLASDGVSKSFSDDAAFDAAIGQLRATALSDWPAFIDALPSWLNQLSEHGSGDDSTMCIAIRPQTSDARNTNRSTNHGE